MNLKIPEAQRGLLLFDKSIRFNDLLFHCDVPPYVGTAACLIKTLSILSNPPNLLESYTSLLNLMYPIYLDYDLNTLSL